jgi:hypothetical protein
LKQGKQSHHHQQHHQHHQQTQEKLQPPHASSERSSGAAAAGRCTRLRGICRSTPWLPVLSAVFAAGTLVAW